jgi:hypothetical protein
VTTPARSLRPGVRDLLTTLAALGRRLPARAIRIGAAALFFVFGAWLAVEAFVTH